MHAVSENDITKRKIKGDYFLMLLELQCMRTTPRKYKYLHIVIRFYEYFHNFFELSIQRMAYLWTFSTDSDRMN